MMDPPPPKPPVKPPLITPSASPPLRSAPLSYRMLDTAPPFKRQRTATPRRTYQDPASSSSSRPQTPVIDVQKEREASKLRLLDVWASLAERYTRPLDEDDLIDINTGEITTDNGVLRNARKFEFGELASADTEGSGDEEEEDEYDLDELDAFADSSSDGFDLGAEGESELEAGGRIVPPVTLLNPLDAEDLREFLEAERKRKELCGTQETWEDCGVHEHEEDDDDASNLEEEGQTLEENGSERDEEEEEGGDEGHRGVEQVNEEEALNQPFASRYTDHVVPMDLASEDELDNWDPDESSIVRPVLKQDTQSDDSDVEIIEPSEPAPPRSAKPLKVDTLQIHRPSFFSKKSQKFPRQLHTPPQSGSSATPIEDFIDLSGDSPPSSSSVDLPPLTFGSSSVQFRQLTPAKEILIEKPPPPKLDLTKVSKGRSLSKIDRHSSKAPQTPIEKPGASVRSEATPRPQALKPFVLLTPRKSSSPLKKSSTSSCRNHTDSGHTMEYIPVSTPSRKGKEKEQKDIAVKSKKTVSNAEKTVAPKLRDLGSHSISDSEDPITVQLSPERPKARPKDEVVDQPTSSCVSKTRLQSREASPPPVETPVSRKRKRVVSEINTEAMATDKVDRTGSRSKSSTQPSAFRQPDHRDEVKPSKPRKRSSSRKRHYSSESEPYSGSEREAESSSSELNERRRRQRSISRSSTLPSIGHYSYPPAPYMPPHHHHHTGHHEYAPIPDPRAQFIITQAMQQLSALVGAPWVTPPHYMDGNVPHTPTHRSQSKRPSNDLHTPMHHHHPYPYAYDPNLSRATLPPDSPEDISSPDKSSGGRRTSLVRRSRSRGRRVSFKFDEEGPEPTERSSSPLDDSPTKIRPKKGPPQGRPKQSLSQGKGKAKAKNDPDLEEVLDLDSSRQGRPQFRGQTPGPSRDGVRKKER